MLGIPNTKSKVQLLVLYSEQFVFCLKDFYYFARNNKTSVSS